VLLPNKLKLKKKATAKPILISSNNNDKLTTFALGPDNKKQSNCGSPRNEHNDSKMNSTPLLKNLKEIEETGGDFDLGSVKNRRNYVPIKDLDDSPYPCMQVSSPTEWLSNLKIKNGERPGSNLSMKNDKDDFTSAVYSSKKSLAQPNLLL